MDIECIKLIKDIGNYELFIGGLITVILFPLTGWSAGVFYLGVGCSFINLLINAYTNSNLYIDRKIIYKIKYVVFYAIRIGFISILSIYMVTKKEKFFYLFISGYALHLIVFIFYGLKLNLKERV